MEEARIIVLLEEYIKDKESLNAAERKELNDWIMASEPGLQLGDEGLDQQDMDELLRVFARMNRKRMDERMMAIMESGQTREKHSVAVPGKGLRRLAVACVAAVLIIAGFWIRRPGEGSVADGKMDAGRSRGSDVPNVPDVLPGTDKATLTLADGSAIALDSVTSIALPEQGNARIEKSANGLLYRTTAEDASAVLYNTVRTDRGGQFQVLLADGSRVWLNSASSLRYPVDLSGKTRIVELTGEAYFEVAVKTTPFFVDILPGPGQPAGSRVQVLGTRFNISSYSDEPMVKTTLLQGSIKIVTDNAEAVLRPGEQARMVQGAGQGREPGLMTIAPNADTTRIIAWKNGYFNFEGADIQTVMRVLARWYDIDVEYKGDLTGPHFDGRIQRNLSLQQVLDNIGSKRIHFRVEGRKVVVSP